MSSTAATTTTTTHILVFPYPAQGHLLALLDLTHQLALRGLKITILVTPKNLPSLNTLLSTHPNSIQTLVLPLPPHPKIPSGAENLREIGNSGNAPITAALSKLEGDIIQWFSSHSSPPQAILSDFFLGWTHKLGEKLNIPRIGFFSARAFLASVNDHLWQNRENHSLLLHRETVEFPDLPRSPSFTYEHLPSIFRKFKEGDSDWQIVKEGMLANPMSWGCVFNSFHALEGEYLDYMKKKSGHSRVYGVGPLSSFGGSERLWPVNPDREARSSVLTWLDKCPDGSVLYVCFGSQKQLTRAQMEALESGLDRSMTRFVWVVKSEVSEGFEERVMGRGLVVKEWASQVEILGHKAVGGFVSHCGWNSLLEGIVAGVMILAWPMEADQFVNARLLVEDLGLAVRLCEGEHTVPDPNELGLTIRESLGGGGGDIPQKVRAKEMREKALEAVKAGGSSYRDLDELVKELNKIGVSKAF